MPGDEKSTLELVLPFFYTFCGAVAGAVSAHYFTDGRERRSQIRGLLQEVTKAAYKHKEELSRTFHFQQKRIAGIDVLNEAWAEVNQARTDSCARLLYLQSDIEIQIDELGQPLILAIAQFSDTNPNPGQEFITVIGEIEAPFRKIQKEIKGVLKQLRKDWQRDWFKRIKQEMQSLPPL